ncbi:type II secretion system inner membrane protein GspF [Vibrio sonorensis]|uniref:type II secretion system inner membrane protein GspF n=1 Tax=Vibrio sonorensis TaxID=1004316 RepID=UPI0008DA5D07|nr:type II secretion system inner membrane protein GspF [Vibrio sonorensis]
MAAFDYKALNNKGKSVKGSIEGDNARQVRSRLKEQGLIPVEVTPSAEKRSQTQAKPSRSFQRGISTYDLALITRQLSTLVQSGMPLEECLKAVSEQSEKPRIRSMVLAVRAKVVEGYTFSDSLADFPQVFDDLFCSMVAAGEKSGHLDGVLERLADYVEKRQKMRSKLIQAMAYPAVLVVVAIGIIIVLLARVVPPIVEQFVQMGQELPQSTQILLSSSKFLQNWGLYLAVLAIALGYLAKWLLSLPSVRMSWDRRIISLPALGKIARGLNTSRFARTLSICTSSAIPILDGMKVATDVISNRYVKQQLNEAIEAVREGSSLRKALENTKLFPPMMLHMIASGEQSGELEGMLTRAADNQDTAFESTVNISLSIFPPLLIALMALFVLFIMMATMMPILEMNNLISR